MKILNKIDFPMIMSYKDTENPNFEPYNYFLNGHNDVVFLADSNFTEDKTESYEYNPWGVLLTQASKNNLLYTARDFDFDTGLQFNRMRYYNPNLGRFSSKDKLFSKNYFLYPSNNPILFYDPFGLLPPNLGFWVQLVLPSQGGTIWFDRDRCEDPAYAEDCFSHCSGTASCVICCITYYEDKNDPDHYQGCVALCPYI